MDALHRVSAGVCLFGPTGTGKTDLAIRIAERFPVEIISVDSAMVYRHMDIGTAKPSAAVRVRIAHHLIDIREPWESYSAGQFRRDAQQAMHAARACGRVPLLVGGTMLYFRALLSGLSALPPADAGIRAAIDRDAQARGWAALHAELAAIDPDAAARIRPTDRQRIQRALEVARITGSTLSELQRGAVERGAPSPVLRIALVPADRSVLYQQLDRRFAAMMRAGFLGEVTGLRAMPMMSAACPAIRAVGYRQIWAHLAGEITLSEAERQAMAATHGLAKRQLTWIRAEAADLTIEPAEAAGGEAIFRALEAAGVSR